MRDVIDGGDQYKKTTPQVSLEQVLLIPGLLVLGRGRQFFSVKGQIVSILDFVVRNVSVAAFLLCCCSENSHKKYINEYSKTVFMKISCGLDLAHWPWLPTFRRDCVRLS